MENIQLIISLSGTVLGLIVTTATFIVKFIKNTKAKKAAESAIAICTAILPYIEQAETFINYSGAEKKAYVMTKARGYAIERGIKLDEDYIDGKIEELVKLTKEVNVNAEIKTNAQTFTFPVRHK